MSAAGAQWVSEPQTLTGPFSRSQVQPAGEFGPPVVVFSDGFENGMGQWQDGYYLDNYWVPTTDRSFSDLYSAVASTETIVGWPSPLASASQMLAGPIDLSGLEAPTLTYKTWYKTSTAYDDVGLIVGAARGWHLPGIGGIFQGDSGGWVSGSLDLSSIADSQTAYISFIFHGDISSTSWQGAYIDDVKVEGYAKGTMCTLQGGVSDGHDHNLADVRLDLYRGSESTPLATTASAADGSYKFDPLALYGGETYRLTATLESKDGIMVMKEKGTTVSLSKDFTYPSSTPATLHLDVDCSKVAAIADATVDKSHLDNCGSVWHYLQVNRQIAKEAGLDLSATLTVNVFAPDDGGSAAYYLPSGNAIYLGEQRVDDDSLDGFPPPWDFKKNRESHEFGHALMHAAMGGQWVAPTEVRNHAGYINDSTGDSLAEGFAEFWTMYLDRAAALTHVPDQYDEWGRLATFNRYMAWSPLDTKDPTATPEQATEGQEELAVAGVLYRVWANLLGADQAGFGKIVAALPTNGTFTDLHDLLVYGGVAAATLDPYFFDQGFFYDEDGDWTRDPGEEVSAGNGANCVLWDCAKWDDISVAPTPLGNRQDRRSRPFEDNAFVRIDLDGTKGAQSESWVTVAIRHPEAPTADFSERTLVTGSGGLVYVCLEPGANAVVSVAGPDGAVSPDRLSFSYDEWMTARAKVDEGATLTKTFRVDRVTVGNPAAPKTMSHLKSCLVTSTLKPRHAAGTFPVRVYRYRLVSGKWKSYGYARARAANYSTYTKCSCKVRLPFKGTWRLRAMAPADSLHILVWSRGYAYVRVK